MGINVTISVSNTVLAFAVKSYLWTLTIMLILCLSRTFQAYDVHIQRNCDFEVSLKVHNV